MVSDLALEKHWVNKHWIHHIQKANQKTREGGWLGLTPQLSHSLYVCVCARLHLPPFHTHRSVFSR